ncbi:MAG: aminotransferase class I/II-fold pyridoxal phosphate-dependent enzyme [Crocinitomicaceae bacterium]|nr:aminotransferase class I/II-fold pyridoxal phosphate-dependent enzyme [Crocinitomicaceae bacterium]
MIHSKLPNQGITIFTTMSKLAAEADAVNMGQGFPGFPIDTKLIGLVEKYMEKGWNQYAPMSGVIPLRRAISQKLLSTYGRNYDPETEINVTAGATQAIFTAITALVNEGDEVVLFAPAYDCYAPAIQVNGGKPVWIQLHYPDYSIQWNELKKVINHRTRMIIINSPLNPGASVLSTDDMEELQKIVAETDIIVLSDEVYEHIVFDGRQHQSAARFSKLAEQSLLVFSFGKTFHATGWKMGYIAGPAPLIAEFRKIHQYNVFSCNSPIQYAIAEYMEEPEHYKYLPDFYQRKRDYFLHLLEGSRFRWKPAAGSYFQLLNYSEISREKDTDIAIKWTKEHRISSIPLSVFYPDPVQESVLRFCFAKEDAELEMAAEILREIK